MRALATVQRGAGIALAHSGANLRSLRVPSSNQSISLARSVSLHCVYVGVWQNVSFRAKLDIYHTALTRSWLSSAPLVGHPLHLVFAGQHSATLFQEWE